MNLDKLSITKDTSHTTLNLNINVYETFVFFLLSLKIICYAVNQLLVIILIKCFYCLIMMILLADAFGTIDMKVNLTNYAIILS